MNENVANNEINNKPKKLGGITGKGFMPGVSGNPSGRPKGTMKDFTRQMFMEMTPEEKKLWLLDNKIPGLDIWKMAEGNPETKTDITSNGESIKLSPEVIALKEKFEKEINQLDDGTTQPGQN